MSRADERALEDIQAKIDEISRRWEYFAIALQPNMKAFREATIGRVPDESGLNPLDWFLDSALDELERLKKALVKAVKKPASASISTAKAVSNASGKSRGRPRDPAGVPAAIRTVLGRHADGLAGRELTSKVLKERPNTEEKDVSAALYPMVKGNEVVREGFHKNYRYKLNPTASETDDEE